MNATDIIITAAAATFMETELLKVEEKTKCSWPWL